MPVYKCTADLRQVTGVGTTSTVTATRIAGWSESWYFQGSLVQAQEKWYAGGENWCKLRATLLPRAGLITEQRIQQVDPPGGTAVEQFAFPANSQLGTDSPGTALLVAFPTADFLNTRNWAIRDLPDARQELGEYLPSQQFTTALVVFQDFIRQNFVIRCVNHSTPKSNVLTVDVAGLVKTKQDHGFAVGDEVSLSRLRNSITTRTDSFRFAVATVPNAKSFTTVEGFNGVAYTKGTVRKYGILYQTIGQPRIERTVQRKVGRPSEEYRGRVSVRR